VVAEMVEASITSRVEPTVLQTYLLRLATKEPMVPVVAVVEAEMLAVVHRREVVDRE
jgi:hypothetical protein